MLAPTLSEVDREQSALEHKAKWEDLYSELVNALLNDPARKVSTGIHSGEVPAYDILYDELAGSGVMRERLARILSAAATQKENGRLQEMAIRYVMDVASSHAEGST